MDDLSDREQAVHHVFSFIETKYSFYAEIILSTIFYNVGLNKEFNCFASECKGFNLCILRSELFLDQQC